MMHVFIFEIHYSLLILVNTLIAKNVLVNPCNAKMSLMIQGNLPHIPCLGTYIIDITVQLPTIPDHVPLGWGISQRTVM